MLAIQTILIPTDFSAAAESALEIARALARDHNAHLVLLTVPTPPPPVSEFYVEEREIANLVNVARQKIESLAANIVDLPVSTRVMAGEPGWSIIAAAKDCGADLIVMGTHGRSGLTRLLLGSVAEHVLRHAPCPVLTIKPGTEQHLKHDQSTALAASAPR